MGLLFFVVLTPAGWIGRLFGHHPLTRAGPAGSGCHDRPATAAATWTVNSEKVT